jgi:hypothetical protein
VTDRRPPKGYDAPHDGLRSKYVHFYLREQIGYDGPTPQFMVIRRDAAGERIIAERCLTPDGVAIVDALRLDYGIATWGTG